MWKGTRTVALSMGLALAVAGCDDGGTGLDPQAALVVGSYSAEAAFGTVVLTTHGPDGETVDWLARGASILLHLHEDMTTTGRLFAPAADDDGGDVDADLAGTWSIDGSRVQLDHAADTFLRDMELDAAGGRLTGEEVFSTETVRVELLRR